MRSNIIRMLALAGMLLALFSCEGVCVEEFVNAEALIEQANFHWQKSYEDAFGREITVDVKPIIPDVEAVPILKAAKLECALKNAHYVCDPSMCTTTEEEFGTALKYYNPDSGDQMEIHLINILGETGITIEYVNQNTEVKSNPAKYEIESFNGDYYLSNEVERTRAYLDGYDLTVQDCVDMANERLGAFFPDGNLDLDLVWVGAVPNSRACYFCTLRQKMRGIPVLMSAYDSVLGTDERDIPFKRPESWDHFATLIRWGSFLSPSWCYIAYVDGGYQMNFTPLHETDLVEADVPLCSMDKVIKSIEERIEKGYIRDVHALRFGYCCYIGEDDENVLYPVWEVECDYYYNPKEKTKDYKELEEVPITNRLMYRTMIVNAQTGEFMDPIELKDKLLDCPKIITWEDVQS